MKYTSGNMLPLWLALAAAKIHVTDPAGAALPRAVILLEQPQSGARYTLEPGRAAEVPAGPWRLRVTHPGFRPYAVADFNGGETTVVLQLGVASYTIDVTSATPLAGLDRPLAEIPAPVQTATAADLESAPDVSAYLGRRMNNVFLNEIQGNPWQPDLNYRGFTASPLLGTPQGVSLYLDGMRLNQAFGDTVSWDLIPRQAVSELALIPGSNPLFGLNTLGGALSLRTKDGLIAPGTTLDLGGGSFGRLTAGAEHGGAHFASGYHWYLNGQGFFEEGWRDNSPSNVRQAFAKLGRQRERTQVGLTLGFANNSLLGNGLQEQRFLERDWRSVYTKPDVTNNRSPFVILNFRRSLAPRWSMAANTYFRHIRTGTLNGDINEESLDQSLYQPNAAERAALAAAGFTGVPASGANAANTPFPFWRCLGNILLRDEPGEKCNGLLNRSSTQQRAAGFAGQVTASLGQHLFTFGGGYDGTFANFSHSTELGYLNPDRSVTPTGVFADGVNAGDADGEPLDNRVNLRGRLHAASVFVADTIRLSRLTLSLSGRFNRVLVDNFDRLQPQPGTGSLTGRHLFHRFNPAIGATYRVAGGVATYASYTEGNRAPSSIELGCADPASPCRLPNAMAGDPPLEQVRTRTIEAGLRSQSSDAPWRWSAGFFRTINRDDILFVASEQTGFGYFKNFDRTRRQGLELESTVRAGRRVLLGGGYTLLDATYQSAEEVNGTGNSSNEDARRGLRGFESAIEIEPGDRIPLLPRHQAKAWLDWQPVQRLSLDFGVNAFSGATARGNENGRHQPDGTYYLGPGSTPGFAVVNAGARWQLHPRVQLYLQANNLFDRRYYSAAQLGPTGFTAAGNFIARPLPAVGGEFPVAQATFYAPGAPRAAWAGLRLRLW